MQFLVLIFVASDYSHSLFKNAGPIRPRKMMAQQGQEKTRLLLTSSAERCYSSVPCSSYAGNLYPASIVQWALAEPPINSC